MRVIFMGTPDFAVHVLDALVSAGHEIYLVVTQPDKPTGRDGALTPPPVKVWADERNLPIYQPEKIKSKEAIAAISEFPIDIGVVAAYGQIIPPEILGVPTYGFINVHASLLPKYRGASPIQWSILNGDRVTGNTIMAMGPGLDDGDIIMQEEITIDEEETGGSLFEKLAKSGGNLCCMAMVGIESGIVEIVPQDESEATYVTTIKKDDGKIDFNRDADYICRQVRAFNPWPSAFTYLNGAMLKIWKATYVSEDMIRSMGDITLEAGIEAPAGCVTYTDDSQMLVRAGSGFVSVTELQLAGKKRMSAHDFLNGNPVEPGTMLG